MTGRAYRRVRHLTAIAVTCLAGCASTAAPRVAETGPSPACVTTHGAGDVLEVACPLRAAGRYRFQADFVGSHDDTVASLSATLDGRPAPCDAGSRTRTAGEDGEVSLVCRIAVADGRTVPVLQLSVTWTHAQFIGTALRTE